ncbi:gp53-like domain-containing protein [Trinickia terrae]|nr:hypothetical protein [Trinickia terrae]
MEANFRVAVANDGPCTFTPNGAKDSGIPKLPLYGGDYGELSPGDLPAGAQVRARLNKALNVANGGAWVIKSISGGMARTATPPVGDMSTRVANMTALFAATDGFQAVDVSGKDDTLLTSAQYGVAMLRLTGELKGSKSILMPAQPGQWIVEHTATGNYNLTAKVTGDAGSSVVLPVGSPVILCSDGKSVKFASAGGQAGFRAIPASGVNGKSIAVIGGYTPGALLIEKNGAMLQPGTAASPDFLATDGVNIQFTQALVADDALTIYTFSTFNVANAVQKSGDAMGGPLALYAGSTVPAPAAGDDSQNVISSAWFKSERASETNAGTARVASQAQTNAGTDDTAIVTPKKLRAGFAFSFAQTGYLAFPTWLGGLIVQWGAMTTSSSGYTGVTYPLAFPNQCFCMLANGLASAAIAANATFANSGPAPKASFNVATLNGSGSYVSQSTIWLAAGY